MTVPVGPSPECQTPLSVPKAQAGHRLGLWTVLATVVGGVVLGVGLVLLVVSFLVTGAPPRPVDPAIASAEELVKTMILDNAKCRGRGQPVRFLEFGPHLTKAEITALVEEAGVDGSNQLHGETAEGVVL